MNKILGFLNSENTKSICLLLAFFCCLQVAQAQVFQWVKPYNDAKFEFFGNSMAADANGNAYYAGSFENTLQIGSFTLNAPEYNMYVAKVDAAGDVIWATTFRNYTYIDGSILDIETDAAGNVYLTGTFRDSISIGASVFAAPNSLGLDTDFFLAKLNSLGVVQWAKHGGGTDAQSANSLSLDASGNIYLSGHLNGTVTDFTYSGSTITGTGTGFLLKTDNNGDLIWSKVLEAVPMSVSVDASGAGYLSGHFSASSLDLGNGITLQGTAGWGTSFLAGFATSGQFLWANLVVRPGIMLTDNIKVKTDPAGNAVAIGSMGSSFVYNTTSLTGQPGGPNLFVLKVNSSGSALWAKPLANMSDFTGWSAFALLDTDAAGNILIANLHAGIVPLDSVNHIYPYHNSTTEVVVAKLSSSSGNLIWAERIGGAGSEELLGMAVSAEGGIYLSGLSDNFASNDPVDILFNNNVSLPVNIQTFFFARLLNNANQITGRVFADLNSSGAQDAGEPGVEHLPISITAGQVMVVSQAGGNYAAYTDSGNFSVTIPQVNPYFTLSPATHGAAFAGVGQTDTANYFALQPIGFSQDLQVSIVELTPVRPGFTYRARIIYHNAGTVPLSGSVKIKTDPELAFLNSIPTVTSNTADTLSWAFSGLQPLETRHISVEWQVSATASFGWPVSVMALIEPIVTDLTPADNMAEVTPFITSSFDPNDKLVSHADLTINEVADRKALSYIVRFQNTGTDTAFTVFIQDQLSPLLDLGTLEVISSSHPHTTTLAPNNTIEWKFSNILLPDSNTNEPESHGYVQYRIKPFNNLSVGQHINTSANIYFDFNVPVATNITDTEIKLPVSAPHVLKGDNIRTWPNPTNERLTLQFTNEVSGDVYVRIFNNLGQEVQHSVYSLDGKSQIEINFKNQQAGVYLLHLQHQSKNYSQKVVVQK